MNKMRKLMRYRENFCMKVLFLGLGANFWALILNGLVFIWLQLRPLREPIKNQHSRAKQICNLFIPVIHYRGLYWLLMVLQRCFGSCPWLNYPFFLSFWKYSGKVPLKQKAKIKHPSLIVWIDRTIEVNTFYRQKFFNGKE